jgi:hypothetical protein
MEWFFLVLFLVLVVPVAVMTSVALVTAESMRRANRLMPGRTAATSPPLRWLWSPGSAAGLHRRLRSTCQLIGSLATPLAASQRRRRRRGRKNAMPEDGIARLAREVLEEAVILDRQVVSASYVVRGLPRAQALAALDYQVRAVEDAARRVHQLATRRAQLSRLPGVDTLSLDQRISAMEAALSELTPPPPAA